MHIHLVLFQILPYSVFSLSLPLSLSHSLPLLSHTVSYSLSLPSALPPLSPRMCLLVPVYLLVTITNSSNWWPRRYSLVTWLPLASARSVASSTLRWPRSVCSARATCKEGLVTGTNITIVGTMLYTQRLLWGLMFSTWSMHIVVYIVVSLKVL